MVTHQRESSLYGGEELAISAWNVRMLMDIASQAITLSKYRMDIVYLSETRLLHFGSQVIIILARSRDTSYIAMVLRIME